MGSINKRALAQQLATEYHSRVAAYLGDDPVDHGEPQVERQLRAIRRSIEELADQHNVRAYFDEEVDRISGNTREGPDASAIAVPASSRRRSRSTSI